METTRQSLRQRIPITLTLQQRRCCARCRMPDGCRRPVSSRRERAPITLSHITTSNMGLCTTLHGVMWNG